MCDFFDSRYTIPPRSTRGSSSAPARERGSMDGVVGVILSLADIVKVVDNDNHMIDHFQWKRPPEFRGTTNPMEAKSWLMQLQIFRDIGCIDDQRVSLATFMMKSKDKH